MAEIVAKPVMFKGTLGTGTDSYSAHLNKAQFVPNQPTATWTDITGKVTNFAGTSGWTLQLGGAQDWATVNSLSTYLNSKDGLEITVTVGLPGGKTATATVIGAAVAVGGTINNPMTFEVNLQVQGKPVIA